MPYSYKLGSLIWTHLSMASERHWRSLEAYLTGFAGLWSQDQQGTVHHYMQKLVEYYQKVTCCPLGGRSSVVGLGPTSTLYETLFRSLLCWYPVGIPHSWCGGTLCWIVVHLMGNRILQIVVGLAGFWRIWPSLARLSLNMSALINWIIGTFLVKSCLVNIIKV